MEDRKDKIYGCRDGRIDPSDGPGLPLAGFDPFGNVIACPDIMDGLKRQLEILSWLKSLNQKVERLINMLNGLEPSILEVPQTEEICGDHPQFDFQGFNRNRL
jgi:hypothetical protein